MKFRAFLLASLLAAYLLLSHWVLASAQQHVRLGIALALAPPVAAAAMFFAASGRRVLLLPLLAGVALLQWYRHDWFAAHFSWLYFLQDAGTQLCLAVMFGRTLFAGQQPLCSRIAAVIHGRLDPALARYTHQVTVAWTLFFVAMTSVSTVLFLFAPLAMWSTFSNLLMLPLTGLMFAMEYALRLYRLPQWRAEMRFVDTFRAYAAVNTGTPRDSQGGH
ncbi:hypothetical protein PTE30175_00575 [Pandoraea terrae]|uniref:Transmembrane protein n=1 Tax=Pandoraea terrae TaxID=1537710 RepID=A0A5E4S9C8_9BURK|nr:hypothetical protein [Pandoraea terrae]VVD71174.1 hypothetical protein PTE30175_00575 [Pandoraea terrae]